MVAEQVRYYRNAMLQVVKNKLYDHLKIISSYFYYFEINSIFAGNNYQKVQIFLLLATGIG